MDDLEPSTSNASGYRFSCPVTVRFRDLDAMGHVNNAVYFTYFEIGREAYTRALGLVGAGARDDLRRRFPFVIAEASCTYVAPATVGDSLDVHLRAVDVHRKSFVFEYLVTSRPAGAVVARGRSTQVAFDFDAEQTIEIPRDYVERLERLEGIAS